MPCMQVYILQDEKAAQNTEIELAGWNSNSERKSMFSIYLFVFAGRNYIFTEIYKLTINT